jgi:nitrous oxidase accessory protein NosD
VVKGGIVVTADRASVRNVTIVGGDYGIDVENAKDVVLDNVTIRDAKLDGIHVRRSSVTIRDCWIESLGNPYGQGIDISFGFDLPESRVEGCTVVGGRDGIDTHWANVIIHGNRVAHTTQRGIAVEEMSMGMVRHNRVDDALGIGLFCGDRSECELEHNTVLGTRPDVASGDRSRLGYGIVSHLGAIADLEGNRLVGNARPVGAFVGAQLSQR